MRYFIHPVATKHRSRSPHLDRVFANSSSPNIICASNTNAPIQLFAYRSMAFPRLCAHDRHGPHSSSTSLFVATSMAAACALGKPRPNGTHGLPFPGSNTTHPNVTRFFLHTSTSSDTNSSFPEASNAMATTAKNSDTCLAESNSWKHNTCLATNDIVKPAINQQHTHELLCCCRRRPKGNSKVDSCIGCCRWRGCLACKRQTSLDDCCFKWQ